MAEDTKSTTPAVPPQGEQEQATTPTKVGKWDGIMLAVATKLLKTSHKEGVTCKQVVDYIHLMKANDPLAKLLPQGTKGASLTTRQGDNTLWRGCPQVAGDKQAGGGYHTPPVLLRSLTGARPVTFTLWSKQEQEKRFGKVK